MVFFFVLDLNLNQNFRVIYVSSVEFQTSEKIEFILIDNVNSYAGLPFVLLKGQIIQLRHF
jgi:hypothetical protein